MEILWEDLRGASEAAPIPETHRQMLDARHQAVEDGTEEVLDWDAVKDNLRSRE
jgi:hypothetical protein